MSDQEKLTQTPDGNFLEGAYMNVGSGSSGVDTGQTHQPAMPVVTQPHHVPLQQIPYQMSLQEQLASFNFTQPSWSVLQNLEAKHGTSSRPVSLVHGGLRNVIATAGNSFPESPESNDEKYRKLLGGVLLTGERLPVNHFFAFGKVEFQHILDSKHGVTAMPKPAMTQGRMYLTNQRLLLLSAGNTAGLQLTDNANNGSVMMQTVARSTSKALTVTGSKTSTCRYESIPLADILGVDMSSVFSGNSSTIINGNIPEQSCWSCCCPAEETWAESPLVSSTNMLGVINVGVLLPPWQTKCNLLVYLPQNSQTTSGVEFIRALQYAVPSFQSSPGN